MISAPDGSRAALTIIELNEFSEELLKRAVDELSVPNIAKLLKLNRMDTLSEESQEHHGLDPWVQWVSVHTGQPAVNHRILRHGDVSQLRHPQYWETLSDQGISSGLWGLMNATRGKAENCRFFLPDPWTYEEKGYPGQLAGLLALPRYFAKNYLQPKWGKTLLQALRTLGFLLHPRNIGQSISSGLTSLPVIAKCGLNAHSMAIAYDILATRLFLAHRRRHQPQLSVIFLNLLAHCQHHFWQRQGWHPAMKSALHTTDRLLEDIFNALGPGEDIMVMNGLTQENVEGAGYCIYRQLDPADMLTKFGIPFTQVEPCMTNDCHVMFANEQDALKAMDLLRQAKIADSPLFHVEQNAANPCQLFYQIELRDPIPPGSILTIGKLKFPFEQLIELLCERTGAHIPQGILYSTLSGLPTDLPNHKVHDLVIQHFTETEKGQEQCG